jgi:pimeloyl-ACP methyl ester carboxylesterase
MTTHAETESGHRPLAARSRVPRDHERSAHRRLLACARLLVVASTFIVQAGCALALKPGEEGLRSHAVFVGSEGEPKNALTHAEARARGIDTDDPMSEADYRRYLDSIVAAIRRNPSDTILLFIHGGRVPLRGGAEQSLELIPGIQASGYYPLFIVWDASQWTTLAWHLTRYRQGLDYGGGRSVLMLPFVLTSDLITAVGRSPFTLGHQLGDLCRNSMRLVRRSGRPSDASCPLIKPDVDERNRLRPIEDSTRAARVARRVEAKSRSVRAAPSSERSDSLGVSWGDYNISTGEQIYRGTTSVLLLPIKFPIGVLVDGLGTGAWDDMVRRTTAMFRPGTELRGPAQGGLPAARRPSGAAGLLLSALDTMVKLDRHREWRIILAGHSMGAIVANRILREYPELPIIRIQYLASAASIADVESSVIPYLRRRTDATFETATLHPFAETGEYQSPKPIGRLADVVVPRGSLLEWIDDYFEKARSPFDRRSGKWRNMALGLHIFPEDVRSRVTIKAFGVGDTLDAGTRFARHPARHGEIADASLRFWCRDYWAVRRIGTPVYALPGKPTGAQKGCPED